MCVGGEQPDLLRPHAISDQEDEILDPGRIGRCSICGRQRHQAKEQQQNASCRNHVKHQIPFKPLLCVRPGA